METDTITKEAGQDGIDEQLQKIREILEKGDGRPFREKQKEAIQYITEQTDSLLEERLRAIAGEGRMTAGLKNRFWKHGEQIRVSGSVALRKVKDTDHDPYLELKKQYTVFKNAINEEGYQTVLWKEHAEGKTLMCSIEKDGMYAGYCGINDLTAEIWEISIELLQEYTRQGIGYAAVKALVTEMKARMGRSEFLVKIEADNQASQKLFEKLGAVPYGMSKYFLASAANKDFDDSNKKPIDDSLIVLAERFHTEPKELLLHALIYKLDI